MDEYLVSQRQAVEMLMAAGLSRRAAYYRLDGLPSRVLVDARVWTRIDVELLREMLTRETAERISRGHGKPGRVSKPREA